MAATFIQLLLNNWGSNETTYARPGRVGSIGIPMLAQLVQPAGQTGLYSGVECTTTGVVCGACTDGLRMNPDHLDYTDGYVRHATADHVRQCDADARRFAADEAAEWPLVAAGWL